MLPPMRPRLSVLDVRGLVEETVILAPFVEALGFARYWIAEHQPQPSPLLTTAIVAGITNEIRVGTAGILFHYYPPLRTAHDFHFLERAYEGRIDAGICGGGDTRMPPEEAEGRNMQAIAADYAARVARFTRHLRNTPGSLDYDPRSSWSGSLSVPPPAWLLGSSARSAVLAAELGMSYGYSLLYGTSVDDPLPLQRYRERLVVHPSQPAPSAIVAVCGACAPTPSAARALAAQLSSDFFLPRIVGEPSACADQLRALAERYGTEEIVFADRVADLDDRKRTYELLAKALG